MPTLLNEKGVRYYFYSNENDEPCHVHVEKGGADGKIWLEPAIKIENLYGFTNAEAKDVLNIITKNYETFKKKWYDFFK